VKLEAGMEAPEFTLHDADGKAWRLTDLRGRGVIVYFYPVDDTPGCTAEACDFRDSNPALQQAGYTVLGISPQDARSHSAFSSKYGLNFPLLIDEDLEVAKAYGAVSDEGKSFKGMPLRVTRSTFVIDPEDRIEHAEYGVKAKGHVDRLKELLSG
jgi:thioredoxin-dependent peroxiredoxin